MAQHRLLYVVGARPNFVKMAPVVAELRRRLPDAEHVVVHTGQHYAAELSEVFIDQLELPEPAHRLAQVDAPCARGGELGFRLLEHLGERLLVRIDAFELLRHLICARGVLFPLDSQRGLKLMLLLNEHRAFG
jgi:hypothetical protein